MIFSHTSLCMNRLWRQSPQCWKPRNEKHNVQTIWGHFILQEKNAAFLFKQMQTNIAKRRRSVESHSGGPGVFALCTHSARPPGYWRWCFPQRWKPDRKRARWRRSDLPWWQTNSPWLHPAGLRLLPTWQVSKIEQMLKVLWKALRSLFLSCFSGGSKREI